ITMFGRFCAWATALDGVRADAVASAASAAPAVRVVRHKLIEISSMACCPLLRMLSNLSRRAASGVSTLDARRMHHLFARFPPRPDVRARGRRMSPDQAARYAESNKYEDLFVRSLVRPMPQRGRRRLSID